MIMTDLDPEPTMGRPKGRPQGQPRGKTKPQTTFEDFSSGAAWRSLPLKIKLTVLKLLSAERDTPPKPRADD